MSTQKGLEKQRVDEARDALQRARDLRHSRRVHGVDGIRQFVKDVDGDWLDNWTDTTITQNDDPKRTVLVLKFSRYVSTLPFLFVLPLGQKRKPCPKSKMRSRFRDDKVLR
ncbi:MAG: hypothetical protein V7K26_30835 [Nostoc sp.]|uniref:hypothetical protein n=1 Tax=Nostoc sp. TaxID=1180 RepID=UPI002FF1D5D4